MLPYTFVKPKDDYSKPKPSKPKPSCDMFSSVKQEGSIKIFK
jgi:hypothetical protein